MTYVKKVVKDGIFFLTEQFFFKKCRQKIKGKTENEEEWEFVFYFLSKGSYI